MFQIGIFLVLFFISPFLFCENLISLHVGGSTYCDEDGCFGPTGIAYGGSFQRVLSDRWSFDMDATLACTWEDLPERLDDDGNLFIPERERTRFWSGVAVVRNWNRSSAFAELYTGAGVVLGYEWQKIIPKSGGSYIRESNSGLKAGVSAMAGYRFLFARKWAVAPEIRFYLLPNNLSAVRYSAVLSRKF